MDADVREHKMADFIEREERLTWPIVDDCLNVGVGLGRWGWTVHALLPVAFVGHSLSDDECETMSRALTRTYKREFRKIWNARTAAAAEERGKRAGRAEATAPSRAPSEPPAHLVHLRGCDKPSDHEGQCRAPSEETT